MASFNYRCLLPDRLTKICLAFSSLFMWLAAHSQTGTAAEPKPNIITLTADVPWVVSTNEPEAIQRVLENVQADWYQVLGHRPIIVNEPPTNWTGPVVYLGIQGTWFKNLVKESFPGPESFVLRVQKDTEGRNAIVATGADVRGAIYAAYALSEEILGVDPWYYWVDKPPIYRRTIEMAANFNYQQSSPTFKYRGWFINDEDLLGGYAPDPMRENVFSLEKWDRICETLLRLRGNMLVPGTFTFPDEQCQDLTARRGLVLNMHHILVVGLNTYRWPKDVPFSYLKHPDIMERYWQTCIDAFKGREVVWAVGYRGKHDRPFWTDEPELKSPEQRGAIMTAAIAKQVELIRKVDPQANMIANLWMEGASMLQAGHLKIPEGVTLVWPDDGTGIIQDAGTVKAGQGTYFHTAMLNGNANQLSEMVNPGRIYKELGRFAKAGATNFFLVNVSDIRPVPLSTECAMRFVWNSQPYLQKTDQENMEAFLTDWSQRQFSPELAKKIAALYEEYFLIPYQQRTMRRGENTFHTRVRIIDRRALPLIQEGKKFDARTLGDLRANLLLAQTNRPYLEALVQKIESLSGQVPEDRRAFYRAHLIIPARVHLHSLEMLESYCEALSAYGKGDKVQTVAFAEKSLAAIEKLFAVLRQAEYGKWACWYFGERFVGLEASRDRVRTLLAILRGEPPPPVHPSFGYPELYQYQERFKDNFPLLYPSVLKGGK